MDKPINIRRLSFFLTGRMPPYYAEGMSKMRFYEFLHKSDGGFDENEFKRLSDISSNNEELFHLCLERVEGKGNGQVLLKGLVSELGKNYYKKPIPEDAVYSISTTVQAQSEEKIQTQLKPVIFTEWKTDAIILKCAWLMLHGISFKWKDDINEVFEFNSSYRIESCDLSEALWSSEKAWGKRLAGVISYWKGEVPAIGFFDRDDDGFEALASIRSDKEAAGEVFNLQDDEDIGKYSYKKRGDKIYAIASPYPIPVHRIDINKRDKRKDDGAFEVEFYLTDDDILKISPSWLSEGSDNRVPYKKLNVSWKSSFADGVVAKRTTLDFSNFQIAFSKIDDFLKWMN